MALECRAPGGIHAPRDRSVPFPEAPLSTPEGEGVEVTFSNKNNYQDSFVILSGVDQNWSDRYHHRSENRALFCLVTEGIGATLAGIPTIKEIKSLVWDRSSTSEFKTRESLLFVSGVALVLLAELTVCKSPKPPSGPRLGPPSGGGGRPHPVDFDLAMPVPRTPEPDAIADGAERKKAAMSAVAVVGGGYALYKLIRAVAFGFVLTPPVGAVSLALP